MPVSHWGARIVEYWPLLAGAIAVYLGAVWYHGYATRHNIVARINSRTLHAQVVPRGAGIVVGGAFSVLTCVAWASGHISTPQLLGIGAGALVATLVGFVDDVREISAARKLAIHAGLALWLLAVWYPALYRPAIADLSLGSRVLVVALLIFVPAWLINLYNFIDGIDGMAIGGAVFISSAVILVLTVTGGDAGILFIACVLGSCCVGFLFLNLPPARMFMGDAGSIFLGYVVAALAIWTILSHEISVWTWLTILAYFIGDTTTTTVCRMVLVPKWYGVHRSHAYQNLARVLNSHARVTYGVAAFHFCWALPLALVSATHPNLGPLMAALALAPVVLWTLRFGPRYSRD